MRQKLDIQDDYNNSYSVRCQTHIFQKKELKVGNNITMVDLRMKKQRNWKHFLATYI